MQLFQANNRNQSCAILTLWAGFHRWHHIRTIDVESVSHVMTSSLSNIVAASRPRSPGGRRNRPPARGPPTGYGCPPASCPLEDQYQCYVRPCQFARCRNFPGARCWWVTVVMFFLRGTLFQNFQIDLSMGYCKKDVTPVLTHWSYVSLALTHRLYTG